MSQKKLGFGLMRLPSLDPNDASKIDIEQTKRWLIHLLKEVLHILIQHGCIVDLIAKMRLKKH